MIRVEGICKRFDPEQGDVLDRISFSLSQGNTLSIIGPSGCGKTTLLYILAGLLPPTSGTLRKGKEGTRDKDIETAFILQDYGLFPWKTVWENVALAPKLKGKGKRECREITAALLEELGLGTLGGRYPVQLSGGQKQRVAIARALALKPSILLMDEPFSSLDAITRERLQDALLRTWQARELTYILVTHSVEEAVFLGRRIIILTDRPARVKAMIDNPGFGKQDYRMEQAYFEKLNEVRRAMG